MNRLFGNAGTLWQDEPFDRLVRRENQLEYLQDYIKNNPVKAKWNPGHLLYQRASVMSSRWYRLRGYDLPETLCDGFHDRRGWLFACV